MFVGILGNIHCFFLNANMNKRSLSRYVCSHIQTSSIGLPIPLYLYKVANHNSYLCELVNVHEELLPPVMGISGHSPPKQQDLAEGLGLFFPGLVLPLMVDWRLQEYSVRNRLLQTPYFEHPISSQFNCQNRTN